jgi:hypothetical protein
MKRAQKGDFDPKARRASRDAACPECHARAMVFADGAVLCLAEGGISFVPEQTDVELWEMQKAYRAGKASQS